MSLVTMSSSALAELTTVETPLLDVTHRYLALVKEIGNCNKINYLNKSAFKKIAEPLLVPDLKKVLNGQVYTESRDAFIDDLVETNQTTSCWDVEPVDIITSAKTMEVVLRLMIKMEMAGMFTAIVILRFNKDYKIFEINEVLNKIEGAYHFDVSSKP